MNNEYWIRNLTKTDIILGDLRYKIPAGQVRNLLSRNSNLRAEDIEKSRKNGSIAVRISKGMLVEVQKKSTICHSKKESSKNNVTFPRRKDLKIVLDVCKLDDELNNMVLEDEDLLLKELQDEDIMAEAPIIKKGEKTDGESS